MEGDVEHKELWDLLEKQKRLGDVLLERGIINADELKTALFIQRSESVPLGEIVINIYHNDECRNIRTLVDKARKELVPEFDLSQYQLKTSHKEWISYAYASSLDTLVLDQVADTFAIAMAFPYNTDSLTKIKGIIREKRKEKNEPDEFTLRLVWVERSSLRGLLKKAYTVWDKFPGNSALRLYLGSSLSSKAKDSFNKLAMMDSYEDIREVIEDLRIVLPAGLRIPAPKYIEPWDIWV